VIGLVVGVVLTSSVPVLCGVAAAVQASPWCPRAQDTIVVTTSSVAVVLFISLSWTSLFAFTICIVRIVHTFAKSALCTIAAGHIAEPFTPSCPLFVLFTASCIAVSILICLSISASFLAFRVLVMRFVDTFTMSALLTITAIILGLAVPLRPFAPLFVLLAASSIAILVAFILPVAHGFTV